MNKPDKYAHIRTKQARAKCLQVAKCGLSSELGLGSCVATYLMCDTLGQAQKTSLPVCHICLGYEFPKYNTEAVQNAIKIYKSGVVKGLRLRQFIAMTLEKEYEEAKI